MFNFTPTSQGTCAWARAPGRHACLERQGRRRDIVEQRKTLRDLHPSLYPSYMKTRRDVASPRARQSAGIAKWHQPEASPASTGFLRSYNTEICIVSPFEERR